MGDEDIAAMIDDDTACRRRADIPMFSAGCEICGRLPRPRTTKGALLVAVFTEVVSRSAR